MWIYCHRKVNYEGSFDLVKFKWLWRTQLRFLEGTTPILVWKDLGHSCVREIGVPTMLITRWLGKKYILFYPEGEHSSFLRNVGKHLPNYTVSYSRIYNLHSLQNNIRVIKWSKIKWVRHVAWAGEMRIGVVGEPELVWPPWKFGHRWLLRREYVRACTWRNPYM
jgi:hypothetical protein